MDRVKARISPAIPCVNADKEDYCTGPCEGSLCFKCESYQPVKPAPVVPEAVQPSALAVREVALEAPASATPAECISFDLGMAKRCATASIYYLVRAGWRLALERQGMAHGSWVVFCQNHVGISDDTARRYIKFFQETVGKFRTNHGQPAMVTELTDKMIAAATADIESKTATGAMIELGVMRRPPGHGGARPGAGRKPRDAEAEAAELDAIANNPALLFAAVKGPLDELWKLHRERDVFARLGDDELRDAVNVLQPLYKCAAGVLEDRMRSKGFPVL